MSSPHTLLNADEILTELSRATPCQDCAGGLGIHVEADSGDWGVVQVHNVPCPVTAGSAAPRRDTT